MAISQMTRKTAPGNWTLWWRGQGNPESVFSMKVGAGVTVITVYFAGDLPPNSARGERPG